MAIGLTPKHEEQYALTDLTTEQFLVLANEAAVAQQWDVGYISITGLIAYANSKMFEANAEIRITIANGIATIQSLSTGSEMMDWGRNKKKVTDLIASLDELKASITRQDLDARYVFLQERMVPQEDDTLTLPPPTNMEQITGIFSIFKPTRAFFVTPILIDLNILLFILLVAGGGDIMQPSSETLLNWGANFRPLTLNGEWWRLITNCFLHIGVFHLLMNMYALLYIGVLLEPHLGKARFIAAYLLTGITASVASLWWHDLTISAGASGAVFGMYGVFLAMLTTNLIEKSARKTLLTSIALFVGYNLVYGLKGGIDNAAHLGGLAGGLVMGYIFIPSLKNPDDQPLKWASIGGLTVAILVCSFFVFKKVPNDIALYDNKIKEFVSMEAMALEVYNLPENTPKEQVMTELKDRGIYYWNENIKLIDSFNELDLPDQVKARNQLLRQYCELRIKMYELHYKALAEDTDRYNENINAINKQIEEKVKELGGEQAE